MQPDLDDLQSTGVRDISHWLIYLFFFFCKLLHVHSDFKFLE